LNFTIAAAVAVVVANQQLIGKDSGQQLSTVVVESAVPDVFVDLKEGFEPLVERFHGLATSSIQASGPVGLLVDTARLAQLPMPQPRAAFDAWLRRTTMLPAAINLRAEVAAARTPAHSTCSARELLS
jgi:hypothetical protein